MPSKRSRQHARRRTARRVAEAFETRIAPAPRVAERSVKELKAMFPVSFGVKRAD